jgi:hypothetical protein
VSAHVGPALLGDDVALPASVVRVLKGGIPAALDEDGDVVFGGTLTAAERRRDPSDERRVADGVSGGK